MSCDPNFMFSIDGHNMTIIEADGVETQPVTVNTLQIFAAQRYSFVVGEQLYTACLWFMLKERGFSLLPTSRSITTGFEPTRISVTSASKMASTPQSFVTLELRRLSL